MTHEEFINLIDSVLSFIVGLIMLSAATIAIGMTAGLTVEFLTKYLK
jgi:hypothetical protein